MATLMRKMVSLGRDVRVATTTGHVYRFKKGLPTSVVYVAQADCEDKGVTFVDDDRPVLPKHYEVANQAPVGSERTEKIQGAMLALAVRQAKGDFTGGGTPDLKALQGLLDFAVSAQERNSLWGPIAQHLALGVNAVEMTAPVAPPDGD